MARSVSVMAPKAGTDLLQDSCQPLDITIQRILPPYNLAHNLALMTQRLLVLQSSSEAAQDLQVTHILLKLHVMFLPDVPSLISHLPSHHRSCGTDFEVFGYKVVADRGS